MHGAIGWWRRRSTAWGGRSSLHARPFTYGRRIRRPRPRSGGREHHAWCRFWRPWRGLLSAFGDRARCPPGGGDGSAEAAQALITTKPPRERAYLVGLLLPGATPELVREQMDELADLTRTAGAEVV